MNRLKAAVVVLGLTLCVGGPLGAQPASTQPQADRRDPQAERQRERQPERGDGMPPFRSERRFDGRGRGGTMRGGGGGGGNVEWRRDGGTDSLSDRPVDEEEWKAVDEFMKKHSPKRWDRLQDISDEARQQEIRNMAAVRYRTLEQLEKDDPALHKIRLARVPIEDEIFALSMDFRRGEKPEEAKAGLRQQLRLMVQNRLQERAHRLEQMRKQLQTEESNVEAAVEASLNDITGLDRWPRDFRPSPPPQPANASPVRGGGGGGGGAIGGGRDVAPPTPPNASGGDEPKPDLD